jgi:hypothetical protein
MSVSDESPEAFRMHPEPDAPEPDASPVMTAGAPLGCPSSGHWFDAVRHSLDTEHQQCPCRGMAFRAAWPGWEFEPRTVVVHSATE